MNAASNIVNYCVETASQCYANYTSEECQDELPGVKEIIAALGLVYGAYKGAQLLNNLRLKAGLYVSVQERFGAELMEWLSSPEYMRLMD
ncbi:MAG: hypothetical protein KR126chlam1_01246 [Chlamydiae bacterium]|nr:hypothetical protein [Chlamydiota bacterium]